MGASRGDKNHRGGVTEVWQSPAITPPPTPASGAAMRRERRPRVRPIRHGIYVSRCGHEPQEGQAFCLLFGECGGEHGSACLLRGQHRFDRGGCSIRSLWRRRRGSSDLSSRRDSRCSGDRQVDLVHHVQAGLLVGFEFLQNAFDLRVLLGGDRAAGIGDLEDQGCALDLFEGRAKSGDQSVRQVADETDSVGQKRFCASMAVRRRGVLDRVWRTCVGRQRHWLS